GFGYPSPWCDAEKGIRHRYQAGCRYPTYASRVSRWGASPDPNPDRSRTRKYSGLAKACQYGGKLAAKPEERPNRQDRRIRVVDIFQMRGNRPIRPCRLLVVVIEAEDRVTLVLAINFPEPALSSDSKCPLYDEY
ncbi:hypothetical protein BO83DRAFT_317012, partial [Aspergillus eucalypticola CBS 122712]